MITHFSQNLSVNQDAGFDEWLSLHQSDPNLGTEPTDGKERGAAVQNGIA